MKRHYISFFGEIEYLEKTTVSGWDMPAIYNGVTWTEIYWNQSGDFPGGAEYAVANGELIIAEFISTYTGPEIHIYVGCHRLNMGATAGPQVALEEIPPAKYIRADQEGETD